MELSFIIGFVFMWIALLGARTVSMKEIRNLNNDKKAELVNMATESRGIQIAIVVVGVAAFYLVSYFINSERELWFGLYGAFILGWMIYRVIVAQKKYREREFPEEFVKAQFKASILRLMGIAFFFVIIGLNFVLNKQDYQENRLKVEERGKEIRAND